MYETYLQNEREFEELNKKQWDSALLYKGYQEQNTTTNEKDIERYPKKLLISVMKSLVDEFEGEKCDERKVKVFGEYEAKTYEDKEMVNAVLQLAIDKINNFINKIQ